MHINPTVVHYLHLTLQLFQMDVIGASKICSYFSAEGFCEGEPIFSPKTAREKGEHGDSLPGARIINIIIKKARSERGAKTTGMRAAAEQSPRNGLTVDSGFHFLFCSI